MEEAEIKKRGLMRERRWTKKREKSEEKRGAKKGTGRRV